MDVKQDHRRSPLQAARRQSLHFLGLAFLFSVFVNLLMLTGPLFMLQVYDRVLSSRSEETLVVLLLLVLFLFALMALLEFSRSRLVARYGARFQAALDDHVFRAELARPIQRRKGLSTASRDLEVIQGFIASPGFLAIMDAPFSPIFIGAIFVFHAWLGWFALAGGAALIVLALVNQLLTTRRMNEAQQNSERAHRFAENARQARDLVRSQGMVEPMTERWMQQRTTALEQSMRALDWTGSISSFTKAFRLALQSLVLALGAWLVLRGELTAGAMIAASILLGRSLAPVEQIIGRWPQIARARQGWAALSTLLETTAEQSPEICLPKPTGQLDVAGLTVANGPGNPPILQSVSFSIAPGEALGVIGRSGSGKSTIARVLLRIVEPNMGEVRLGGALLDHYVRSDLGNYIGYLPQEPMLISGTIAENIARMALVPESAKVVDAAKRAKAHELILGLPDGYDTRVEDNTIELSGGEKQRIALARALYDKPIVLVLDEPNSALDAEGTEALNAAVSTMKSEDRSVVVMTHRPMAISNCDRLLVLESGKVSGVGPRDEILKSMLKNASQIRQVIKQGEGHG